MTAINHLSSEYLKPVVRDYEDDEPNTSFYVDRELIIYEVKLFQDFALIKPIMPDHNISVQRIDLMAFAEHFAEYEGDHKELRAYLFGNRGLESIFIEKTRK